MPADYQSDGQNVSAAFRGKPIARSAPLFWEYGRNDTAFKFPAAPDRSPPLALREGNWKFLCHPDGTAELYNLATDPYESKNLAASQTDIAQR